MALRERHMLTNYDHSVWECSGNPCFHGNLENGVLSKAPGHWHKERLKTWIGISRPQQSRVSQVQSSEDSKQLDITRELLEFHVVGWSSYGVQNPNNEKFRFCLVGNQGTLNVFEKRNVISFALFRKKEHSHCSIGNGLQSRGISGKGTSGRPLRAAASMRMARRTW